MDFPLRATKIRSYSSSSEEFQDFDTTKTNALVDKSKKKNGAHISRLPRANSVRQSRGQPLEMSTSSESLNSYMSRDIDVSKMSLKENIARGPYGTIYHGRYSSMDVAVKLLDWGEEDTMSRAHLSVLRKAFTREVELWNQISHPNISKFIGASIAEDGSLIPSFRKAEDGGIRLDGDICCLLLEYAPGGNLRDFLARQNPKKLKLKNRIQMALDAANGLAYLHSIGLLHYAISARCMQLNRKGTVKIMDLGAGLSVKGNGNFPKTSSENDGSAYIMAPEALDGSTFTEKSDVYAFGLCLWEICCCNISFTDEQRKKAFASGKKPQIPTNFPRSLQNILNKCWETDPSKRPQMNAVVSFLKEILHSLEKKKFSLSSFWKITLY